MPDNQNMHFCTNSSVFIILKPMHKQAMVDSVDELEPWQDDPYWVPEGGGHDCPGWGGERRRLGPPPRFQRRAAQPRQGAVHLPSFVALLPRCRRMRGLVEHPHPLNMLPWRQSGRLSTVSAGCNGGVYGIRRGIWHAELVCFDCVCLSVLCRMHM